MTRRTPLSAAWPLNVAIAAVIEAEVAREGSPLSALLDTPPVYSGIVDPPTTVLSVGRIVLAASQENDAAGTFSRLGMENIETIDIWTADTSKKTSLMIYGALKPLLHRVPLAVADYGTVRGSLELIVTMLDPSREQYHAQARYTAYSLNPA
jgi:hypothetical protein